MTRYQTQGEQHDPLPELKPIQGDQSLHAVYVYELDCNTEATPTPSRVQTPKLATSSWVRYDQSTSFVLVVGMYQTVRIQVVARVNACFTVVQSSVMRNPLQHGARVTTSLSVRNILHEEIHGSVWVGADP